MPSEPRTTMIDSTDRTWPLRPHISQYRMDCATASPHRRRRSFAKCLACNIELTAKLHIFVCFPGFPPQFAAFYFTSRRHRGSLNRVDCREVDCREMELERGSLSPTLAASGPGVRADHGRVSVMPMTRATAGTGTGISRASIMAARSNNSVNRLPSRTHGT